MCTCLICDVHFHLIKKSKWEQPWNIYACVKESSISCLSGNKLTLDNIGQVMEEVLDVSAQWYLLGLQLKVRTGTLDNIQTQFSDPKRQLLEVLKTWLTTSDNTSWKTLTDALRSRSVGASQLADVLETKYCLVEGTLVMDTSPSDGHPNRAILPSPVSPVLTIISQRSDMQESIRKCH